MAHKNPVVVSTDGKKHETLGSSDTLAPGSIPISAESGNGLSVKSDGLFAEPGGGGGGLSEVAHNNSLSGAGTTGSPLAVRISGRAGNAIKLLDLATSEGGLFAEAGGGALPGFVSLASYEQKDLDAIKDQYDAMKSGSPVTVPTQWHYLATLSSGEQIGSDRNSVYLTAIPAGDGQIISWDGLSPQGAMYGNYVWQHEKMYVDGSGDTIILASQTDPIVIRHDNSLLGEGSTRSELQVQLSQESGNGLSLKDDGLFALLASGGGIPGFGEPNIIPDPTDIGMVEAKYYDLLMDSSITEGVMYHYPTLTSGGETLENVGQGVLLYAIPAGDGVIASYSGVFAGSNQQGLRVRYMDSGNTVLLVDNMRGLVLNTDSTLTGWGELSSQLAVQVSADSQNELTVLQPENSDTPGLFARPISAMLFAADDSIVKTSNYQGNPKNAAIAARISTRANNNLRLIPNSESSAERGLFASKMTRGTGGGNWSFGYPDSPGAKNACGKIGSGVYWKSTIEMSNANAGDVNVKVDVWIKNLPCMEDGTLVSHRVLVDYVSATTSAKPTAAIWLICDTAPTHMINIETKTITKLQRSPESTTTGLPDYPTAPDGEYAQEFTYSRQYFYMA